LPSDVRPSGESATPTSTPIASKAATSIKPPVASNAAVATNASSGKPLKGVPSSALSADEAKKVELARQAQREAFHGRLAGIKHNVDDLNHKLDDLESKS
jgi:hypothetical protein